MTEITKKSVLIECLEYEREIWKLSSKRYDTMEPMKGMEKEWEEQREKCRILQELIQALDSEPVRREMAQWQRDVMAGKIENITEKVAERVVRMEREEWTSEKKPD